MQCLLNSLQEGGSLTDYQCHDMREAVLVILEQLVVFNPSILAAL